MKTRRVPWVVVPRPVGMLGNRIFLGAYFAANSMRLGYRFLYPALGEYAELFAATSGKILCGFPGGGVPGNPPGRAPFLRSLSCKTLEAFTHPVFSPAWRAAGVSVIDLARTNDARDEPYPLDCEEFRSALGGSRFVVAKGWKFRDDEALRDHAGQVRDFFSPVPELRAQVHRSVDNARSVADRVIGVHVRRGDYAGWLGGRYFFPVERYIAWMREALALWPGERVAFVVCSNENLDNLSEKAGAPVFPGPGSACGDLYALAACDAIIGPPSTFGLWASFFGQTPFHMVESVEQRLHPVTFTLHDRA